MRERESIFGLIAVAFLVAADAAAQTIGPQQRQYSGVIGGRPPRITEQPTDLIIPKNEPAKLTCKADGIPTPFISWYRDQGELVSSEAALMDDPASDGTDNNIIIEQPRIIQQNGDLHFSRVVHGKKGRPDTGVYWCLAKNQFGEARSRNVSLQVSFLRDEFRREPNASVITSVGQTLMLMCQVPRGFPVPKVTWKHNGRELLLTGRLTLMDEGNLVISNIRQSDAGSYICVAENMAGYKESQRCDMTVMAPPVFEVQPQDVTALADDNVVFECKAVGEPQPELKWWRGDGRSLDKEERIRFPSDGSLRIEHVAPIDEGNFVCGAENEAGSIKASASLTVHIRPNFLWVPRDQRVAVNATCSFDCLATGSPPPAVFWTKEGSQILMFPGQPHGRFSVQSDGRLVIDKTEPDDSGVYICSALSVAGSAVVKAYLEVSSRAHGPPPIITLGPANQTLAIGSVAVLPCVVAGEPPPTFHWQKDGAVISLTSNPRISIHETGALQISDLRIADSGIYTCSAASVSGRTSWPAGLVVESPTTQHVTFHRMADPQTFPAAPSKPQIVNISDTSVELQWWQMPTENKSNAIKMYRVEYFSPDVPGTWTVASHSVVSTRAVVRDLLADTSYVFLVRSSNMHGLSPPSPVSDSVRTLAVMLPMPNYDASLIRNVFARDIIELSEAAAYSSTAVIAHWNIIQDAKYISHYNASIREIPSTNLSTTHRHEIFAKGAVESQVFFGLKKFTKYEIKLAPCYRDIQGKSSKSVVGATSEDVPDEAPQSVVVNLVNLTAIHVSWSRPPPEHTNGRLAGYRVFIIPTGSMSNDGNSVQPPALVRNVTIDRTDKTNELVGNLTAGMRYRVTIAARTDAGLGVFSRPVYVRMESNISGTTDLLREPWFIAALGGILLLLLAAFCAMLVLRRRAMKAQERTKLYSFKRTQSAVDLHLCQPDYIHGTLLPNSIVGMCDSLSRGVHPHVHSTATGFWINRDGIWEKGHQLFADRCATLEHVNRVHGDMRDKPSCPVHGYHSQRVQVANGTLLGRDYAIPPTAEPEGLTSATSTASSKGRSYPDTISVPSQKSTPRSLRASLLPQSDLIHSGQRNQPVMNWSDFIPPPPQCPPPHSIDKYSISSCQDESEISPGMEYVSRKYAYRGRRCPPKAMDHFGSNQHRNRDPRLLVQRQMEMARERRYLMAQMSLDRGRFGQRERSRDNFVYEFVSKNLQRARSYESSIAYDEDESRTDFSSNDGESVEHHNAETSPCLSSEASFFLETDFVEAVKKASGLSDVDQSRKNSKTDFGPPVSMWKCGKSGRDRPDPKPRKTKQRQLAPNGELLNGVSQMPGKRTSDNVRNSGRDVMTLPLKGVPVRHSAQLKQLPLRPKKLLPDKVNV